MRLARTEESAQSMIHLALNFCSQVGAGAAAAFTLPALTVNSLVLTYLDPSTLPAQTALPLVLTSQPGFLAKRVCHCVSATYHVSCHNCTV